MTSEIINVLLKIIELSLNKKEYGFTEIIQHERFRIDINCKKSWSNKVDYVHAFLTFSKTDSGVLIYEREKDYDPYIIGENILTQYIVLAGISTDILLLELETKLIELF